MRKQWSIVLLAITFIAVLIVGAHARDAKACNAPVDIASYYAIPGSVGHDAFVYRFDGEEAQKLIAVVVHNLGPIPMGDKPTVVYVGADNVSHDYDLFFYGADGCWDNFVPAFAAEDAVILFDKAGVAAPFGKTYNQIPGTPGAHAGFAIGRGI